MLDNLSVHHSPVARQAYNAMGLMTIFTAPYSPQLNAIEYFFHEFKSALSRRRAARNTEELKDNVRVVLRRYKQHNFQNYFDHVRRLFPIARRLENFP